MVFQQHSSTTYTSSLSINSSSHQRSPSRTLANTSPSLNTQGYYTQGSNSPVLTPQQQQALTNVTFTQSNVPPLRNISQQQHQSLHNEGQYKSSAQIDMAPPSDADAQLIHRISNSFQAGYDKPKAACPSHL